MWQTRVSTVDEADENDGPYMASGRRSERRGPRAGRHGSGVAEADGDFGQTVDDDEAGTSSIMGG